MGKFFSRERFGGPQILAGLLLLAFLFQCIWLTQRSLEARPQSQPEEAFRLQEGLQQWRGPHIAGLARSDDERENQWPYLAEGPDPHHSPMYYLVPSAPLLLAPGDTDPNGPEFPWWLVRVPYLMFGLLLGASLWYVARRLYGNEGGYIALALYCFSPAIIRSCALWFVPPEMAAAWGAFGTVFTAIAVSHTLYAPREVVLWNWRRTLLLGLALALAVGSQFSLVAIVPLALAFMLYLAPTRRGAAFAIWAAACGVALLLLLAAYSFQPTAFWEGLRHAEFFAPVWKSFTMSEDYLQLLAQVGQASPALVVAVPVAVVAYAAWRRARYFGNTAPLLVVMMCLLLALGSPHYPGLGFELVALPFLFVFVAGVVADLLETKQRSFVLACVWGLLVANGIWNVMELLRIVHA